MKVTFFFTKTKRLRRILGHYGRGDWKDILPPESVKPHGRVEQYEV